jgi:hypothetical protein
VPQAGIISHWDPPDDPGGNWQHVFEGHDVAPDEVEALIREYWNVKAAWEHRKDGSKTMLGTSVNGRTLKVVFRVIDPDSPRVYVITCFPLE